MMFRGLLNRCVPPCRRAYFFLSCQEKVAKKKARPQRRPATPGALRYSAATGGLRNSGLRPSDSPRPFSRCVLRCSTTQRADRKPTGNRPPMASGSVWCAFPSPSCSAEQRRGAVGSRRGLSEGRSPEFRSPPLRLSSAEHPAKPGDAVGATSFWLLFLGKTRKSTPARQARNTAPQLPQETSGKASEHSSAATHQFQREVEEQPAAGAVEPGRDRRRSLEAAGNRRR